MAPAQGDVEAGAPPAAVPGRATRTWAEWAKQTFLGLYIVEYTGLRELVDQEWGAFVADKKAELVTNFPPGPALYSSWVSSSQDGAIFRRFDWLSTYCLVDAQTTLAKCEVDLRALCEERSREEAGHRQAEHDAMVAAVRESLVKYSDLAEAKQKLLGYPDPEPLAYKAVLTLCYAFSKNPRTAIDHKWLLKDGDLMTLDTRPPKTHLAQILNAVLGVLPGFVLRQLHLTNTVDRQRYGPKIRMLSHDRLMALTLIISTVLALVFILVPVGMLYFFVDNWSKWQKFSVLIGWSTGFLIYLWLGTNSSPYESLGASATYCALLVVFLGLS